VMTFLALAAFAFIQGHELFSREANGASRAARRCTAPVAGLFSEDWMNRLGTATASRKLWALPRPAESLGPGSVILAHPGSFDHYFLESLVLILEHGPDGTKGVLLNHETPWTVEDLAPDAKMAPFAANAVFLGGDAGRDTITMVHGEFELPGAVEVGQGVYTGGVDAALRAVTEGALPPDRFKFFYKSVEWLPNALPVAITSGTFQVIELSPGFLFGQSGQRSMWAEVREELVKEEAEEAAAALKLESMQRGPSGAADATDAGRSLAAEAGEMVAKLRKQVEGGRAASKALKAEEAALAQAEFDAHEAKVKALVEQIRRDREEGTDAPYDLRILGPDLLAEKARFEARLEAEKRLLDAQLSRDSGIALGLAPEAEGQAAAEAAADPAADGSATAIAALLAYRVFKGNSQWRVRWRGYGAEGDTWESIHVLDTEELRKQAQLLKEQSGA